jgi:putative oxidoreductase
MLCRSSTRLGRASFANWDSNTVLKARAWQIFPASPAVFPVGLLRARPAFGPIHCRAGGLTLQLDSAEGHWVRQAVMTDREAFRDAIPVDPTPDTAAAESAPAPTRAQNMVARLVRGVALLLPYTFVALVLRLVVARAFFVAGQSKVDGPAFPVTVPGFDGVLATVILPMSVKDGVYQMFDQLGLWVPSSVAGPLVSGIEFIMPILLVLGLATRFAAIVLLLTTAAMVATTGGTLFWSLHVYWISMLLVLISLGPGMLSVDHLLRRLYEK